MPEHEFKTKLIDPSGRGWAALKPPFDVPSTFQRKGRVPVKGTINGFPFRSSLMNMGDGHMMVINAEMRAGAKCQAGDTVSVVMALDEEERKIDLPAYLKKILAANPKMKEAWSSLSFTHQKEHVRAVEDAKKPETRGKRIAAMLNMLRERAASKVRSRTKQSR